MRFCLLVLSLIVLLIPSLASAQNYGTAKRTYRIIAYRSGDTTITSQSNYIDLIPELSVYIPNAFTPNGDGLNDTFGVKGEDIGQFQLLVYDRWGEIIFSSTDPALQWDGKYKGRDVPQGAYAYKYIALGVTKGVREKSGTVTLVR